MLKRRLDLGLRWNKLAEAAGISPEALRAIRRGQYRPSPDTARALDNALQWTPGSVDGFYEGRTEPQDLTDEESPGLPAADEPPWPFEDEEEPDIWALDLDREERIRMIELHREIRLQRLAEDALRAERERTKQEKERRRPGA